MTPRKPWVRPSDAELDAISAGLMGDWTVDGEVCTVSKRPDGCVVAVDSKGRPVPPSVVMARGRKVGAPTGSAY